MDRSGWWCDDWPLRRSFIFGISGRITLFEVPEDRRGWKILNPLESALKIICRMLLQHCIHCLWGQVAHIIPHWCQRCGWFHLRDRPVMHSIWNRWGWVCRWRWGSPTSCRKISRMRRYRWCCALSSRQRRHRRRSRRRWRSSWSHECSTVRCRYRGRRSFAYIRRRRPCHCRLTRGRRLRRGYGPQRPRRCWGWCWSLCRRRCWWSV